MLWHDRGVIAFIHIVLQLLADLVGLLALSVRPSRSRGAENLFLRRQLALYRERGIKAHRVDAATRVSMTLLSRLFDWRDALVVVRPVTLIRWHRAGWRLFWRFKSRRGRPRFRWSCASSFGAGRLRIRSGAKSVLPTNSY